MRLTNFLNPSIACLALILGLFGTGCSSATADKGDLFVLEARPLISIVEDGQVASGGVSDEALAQPIQFPHYTHAVERKIDCQYCHSSARRSIHSGVPPTETCMGCHKMVNTDSPEIQKLAAFFASGEPIPWQKVHDLPDYVTFSHKRHIQGGLDCTECHGADISLQGKDAVAGGDVMKRDADMKMQMGWCLDCHENHDSVDKNYGEQAETRRAELKDCWTCHK